MATYSIRLYQNSGFNAVNIPDSPDLLNTVTYKDTDAIEILQQRWLNSIDVRATWADVKDCDYVRVEAFFYFVNGVQMLSAQTARLTLIPDFITSSGGLKNPKFTILDGITDRATVAKANDTWGAYTEEDPLLIPNQPLQLETTWGEPSGASTGDSVVFIETTVDIPEQSIQNEGDTYKDSSGGECTVPKTYGVTGVTSYNFTEDETNPTDINNGTVVYQSNSDETIDVTQSSGTTLTSEPFSTTIKRGLAKIRALGIETGSIINQWRVPSVYIGDTTKVSEPLVGTDEDGNTILASDQRYQVISSANGVVTFGSSLSAGYATVKNQRLLYGEHNKYGIMTAAGNSMEVKPEEIMSSAGDPSVSFKSDPRPDGKPYYRFTTINGSSEFWRNAIAGETWQNVPLVYQGASGTALNRLNYGNQRYVENVANQYAGAKRQQQAVETNQVLEYNRMILNANLLTGAMSQSLDAGVKAQSGGNIIGSVIGSGSYGYGVGVQQAYLDQQRQNAQVDYTLDANQIQAQYEAQREVELSQLYVNNLVYVPTVNFPYNASIIRDVKGNGVLLYKYRYSDSDITRLDKILTMYGYKESEPLTTDNFNRRSKFDYVAANGVTVTGFSKWYNDGIAAQLRAGVRIWHVLPTATAYTDND